MTRNMSYKEVLVTPLEARREAMALMAALAIIAVLMALRFTLLTGEKAQREIMSYQRLDYVLKDQQPILYRSLLSVVDEVADLREQEGGWPAVELLEKESIPPFAKVFLPLFIGYEFFIRLLPCQPVCPCPFH